MSCRVLVPLFVCALVIGSPAIAGAECFTGLGNCFIKAAGVDDFWWRWAAGLDCELEFVNCLRIYLLGY